MPTPPQITDDSIAGIGCPPKKARRRQLSPVDPANGCPRGQYPGATTIVHYWRVQPDGSTVYKQGGFTASTRNKQ